MGSADVVAGELYRLGRELRISAQRIEQADPAHEVPDPLRRWADRLDAAAGLAALRLQLAPKDGDQVGRRLGERLGRDVEVG
jgi:HAMP domain-containing protein